jgi:hypothetical protein
VLARADILRKAGLFNENIFVPADWQMWLKMAALGGAIGYIDLPLTMYRVEGNYTFNRLELAYQEEEVVIDEFFKTNAYGEILGRQARANMHLRFAQCYLLKNNLKMVWQGVFKTFQLIPWHLKAWVFVIALLLARPLLAAELHRRIIRYDSKP